MLRYHLLGGDSAMPDGLYAGLYHAFVVIIHVFSNLLREFAIQTTS